MSTKKHKVPDALRGHLWPCLSVSDLPVNETCLPTPRNPHAVSKAAAEMLCRQWRITNGLDVVIARPFNPTGPGQHPGYALSGFARDIAALARHLKPPRIEVGDIQITRDFSDALDPQRLRPTGSWHRRIYGDHSKITAHTGWQPTRSIEDTLHSLLDYWTGYSLN